MSRFHHRRGISQQITRTFRNKDHDFLDFKRNLALSSEHTRSTALTNYKSREKDNKQFDRDRQKTQKQGQTKESKARKQMKIQEPAWNFQQTPYSPEEVLKNYYHLLEPIERSEIKQYRNIYYIGNKSKQKQIQQQDDEHVRIKRLHQQGFFKCKIGSQVSYRYEIVERINRGSFGQVFKAYDHKSKQYIALKIVKKMAELVKQTFIQISILTSIKEKDKSDISGIVRIRDFSLFRQHICISFQLLDSNLYELLHANQFRGLNQSCVKIFGIQILNSLNFLYHMNIIHCDIKPENVVLKVWGKSGIKLVDFGTSCYKDQQVYSYIQSRYYRAPQIIFEKRYTSAIDMWSFACLLAELSLGRPLFPGHSDTHQLAYFINLIGYPEIDYSHKFYAQIQKIKANKYFQKDSNGLVIVQNLDRFERDFGYTMQIQSLKPLEQRFAPQMYLFVHFLKQILKWDPNDRITPVQALQHPWVTGGFSNEIRQLHLIYQKLDQSSENNMVKTKKQPKNKSKSKSKSRQKQYSIQSREKKGKKNQNQLIKLKSTIIDPKSILNISKIQSKYMKFQVPQIYMSLKPTSKNKKRNKKSEQKDKSGMQQLDKSPKLKKNTQQDQANTKKNSLNSNKNSVRVVNKN